MASRYVRWVVFQCLAGEWLEHSSYREESDAMEAMSRYHERYERAYAFALYRHDLPSPVRRKLKSTRVFDLPAECDI